MEEKILIRGNSPFSKNFLTVTNMRFYGRTIRGKHIDLPIDSIKSVGNGFLRGVIVTTQCEKFRFIFIRKYKKIPMVVSKFLITKREQNV